MTFFIKGDLENAKQFFKSSKVHFSFVQFCMGGVSCLFFAVVLRVPLEGQSCILFIKALFDSRFHQASSLNGQNLENAD